MQKQPMRSPTSALFVAALALGATICGSACSANSEGDGMEAAAQHKLSGRYEPGPAGYRSAWFSDGVGGNDEVRLVAADGSVRTGTYEVRRNGPTVLRIVLDGETVEYSVNFGKSLSDLGASTSLTTSSLGPREAKVPSSSQQQQCELTSLGGPSSEPKAIRPASLRPAGDSDTTSSSGGGDNSLLGGCVGLLSDLKDVAATASLGDKSSGGGDTKIARAGGTPEPFSQPVSAAPCKSGCFRSTCGCVANECASFLDTFTCGMLPRGQCKDPCK